MVYLDQVRRLALWILALTAVWPSARAQVSASPFVSGAWSGNVTSTSATVCIRLGATSQRVRLVVSANEQLSSPVFSVAETSAATSGNIVSLDIAGLQPATTYYYGIEVGGVLRTEVTSRGRFRTFPQGAGSFRIALVGDTDYRETDHRAEDAVAAEQPQLIIFNGDLHYSDLNTTIVEDYRVAYDNTLKHPSIGAMLRGAPVAYVWDDHDFAGGDNSDGTADGKAATRQAYREYVPHYPLAVGDGTIGQAFTIGRVRVVMTDLRSASVPAATVEGPNKTKMGVAQKAWFKQELIAARDAAFPLILWVDPDPWIGGATPGDDSWLGYTTERTEIANFLKDNRIRNLVVLGGDMHALAFDDGRDSDYATGGGAPLIVLHAAPLSRDPNIKGGPYTAGPFLARGQYGVLDIADTGGSAILATFSGKRVGEGAKFVFQFAASAAGLDTTIVAARAQSPADRAFVNLSVRGRIATPSDTMIAGFVIAGLSQRTVLLRAVGPSLAAFGVTDAISRPVITVYNGSTVIATNDGWGLGDVTRLTDAFNRAGAFQFASRTSLDAALLLPLAPGAYTMQVTSQNGAAVPTGSVLIEAYELQ